MSVRWDRGCVYELVMSMSSGTTDLVAVGGSRCYWHSSALRDTFNRMLGCLYHCLQTGQLYDESTAFAARLGDAA